MKSSARKRGMTLFEILTALAILGVVSGVVYKTVVDSMRVWRQGEAQVIAWQAGTRMLARIGRELRAVSPDSFFRGSNSGQAGDVEKDSIEFQIMERGRGSPGSEYFLRYSIVDGEPARRGLQRGVNKSPGEPAATAPMGSITGLDLKYYREDTGWTDSWGENEQGVPELVRVSLHLEDGEKITTMTHIPAGR